jgi:cytochrome d ubiquinol oxidase subunit I
LRTRDGYSDHVSAGSTWFTLLGYMGMYTVLGIAFLFLVQRLIVQGPSLQRPAHEGPALSSV